MIANVQAVVDAKLSAKYHAICYKLHVNFYNHVIMSVVVGYTYRVCIISDSEIGTHIPNFIFHCMSLPSLFSRIAEGLGTRLVLTLCNVMNIVSVQSCGCTCFA